MSLERFATSQIKSSASCPKTPVDLRAIGMKQYDGSKSL